MHQGQGRAGSEVSGAYIHAICPLVTGHRKEQQ